MAINAKKNSGAEFEKLEAGSYLARCVQMIHIGTVEENIGGKEKKLNKVRITFELPTEQKVFKEENGMQPHLFSKDYTLSMSEKSNLRKMLESWRGEKFSDDQAEDFDITVLLGVPCMLSIIHNDKGYAEISGVSKPMKGSTVPSQITPSKELNYKEAWDQVFFESLPDFIRKKMESSEEYKDMLIYPISNINGNNSSEEDESGLPF